jgi:hypothetical protein
MSEEHSDVHILWTLVFVEIDFVGNGFVGNSFVGTVL